MKRVSIIIKGYSNDEDELDSDTQYVNQYATFLNSNAGGAWDEDEIIVLNEPKISDLESLIADLKPEYALMVFIGHGATQDDHQLFKLNRETIVKPGQFTFDVDKQLIIVESCREVVEDIAFADIKDKIPKYKYGGYIRGHLSRETAQGLFYNQLEKCENGIVICFACSKNESAIDYFFSCSLLTMSNDAYLDTLYHYRTFDILDIMTHVIEQVKQAADSKYGEVQTPEVIGDINFPFAVSKFDLVDHERKA